ncbi:MAG TPA: phosphonate ABC transporter, permease protein PhnE [Stenomitos sp.]
MSTSTEPIAKPQAPSRMPARPKRSYRNWAIAVFLLAVLVWAFAGSQFNLKELILGSPKMVDWLRDSLPPDFSTITDPSRYSLPPELHLKQLFSPLSLGSELNDIRERWWTNTFPQTVVGATIQTIQMALAGTFLATLFAFPLSFLAARNTSPHPVVYHGIKLTVNFLRSIPDFAIGLMLITAIGLGPFTGTMALAFHTTTVLIKLLAESIENIDAGVIEAIQATGARYLQVISFAVVPQVMPDFISFVLYRFETNIRSAAVLGLIGAGGIGFIMKSDFSLFQYPQAATTVLVLIVLVMLVDYTSARLRKFVI